MKNSGQGYKFLILATVERVQLVKVYGKHLSEAMRKNGLKPWLIFVFILFLQIVLN